MGGFQLSRLVTTCNKINSKLTQAYYTYCKWQELHRRKVSQFNGFCHNVGKTFAVLNENNFNFGYFMAHFCKTWADRAHMY